MLFRDPLRKIKYMISKVKEAKLASKEDPIAVALCRLGGFQGSYAWAKIITLEEHSESTRKDVLARGLKTKKEAEREVLKRLVSRMQQVYNQCNY